MTLVGWYVHHHGKGHLTRFQAVREHLDAEVVVFSTLPAPDLLPARTTWIRLARDDEPTSTPDGAVAYPADASPTASGLLHWAPLGHPGHASRLAVIAAAVAERPFDAFVVDVSVEVTLLVRLLGVAVVVVTQPGDRTDEPHRLAYAAAARIVAPWPRGAHETTALDPVLEKVRWVGGISRFAPESAPIEAPLTEAPEPGTVVVLGAVGDADSALSLDERIALARESSPDTRFTIVGATPDTWVADPFAALRRAEVVVAAAGQNSIADIAASASRAVVIAEDRPFGEQAATARTLAALGLAVACESWPEPDRWPALLASARALRPDWSRWQVDGAAQRAAAVIAEVASWS